MPVTQFNMKYVEQAGLVKFDFLGLKTLTVLQRAPRTCCEAQRHRRSTSTHLPLDDTPTYEMLARGETAGVFQLESSGMRDVLRQMQPDRSRTSSRWWRCTARARWTTSRPIIAGQARRGGARLPASVAASRS